MTGKAAKIVGLSAVATLLLAVSAMATNSTMAVAVGATTGSSLRMRAEASTSSAIVSTLSKGVAVAILDDSLTDWYRVSYDGNVGYISADYLVVDQDNRFTTYGRANVDAVNVRASASMDGEIRGTITKDTMVTINGFEDGWYDVTCKYGTTGFIRSDYLDLTAAPSTAGSGLIDTAMKYLGTRYVYGGSSPKGFECSGFTSYVYMQHGVTIARTAPPQWHTVLVPKNRAMSALEPGTLIGRATGRERG